MPYSMQTNTTSLNYPKSYNTRQNPLRQLIDLYLSVVGLAIMSQWNWLYSTYRYVPSGLELERAKKILERCMQLLYATKSHVVLCVFIRKRAEQRNILNIFCQISSLAISTLNHLNHPGKFCYLRNWVRDE